MKSYSYHLYKGSPNDGLNWSSCASDKYPLMVNCAGRYAAQGVRINTHNPTGRLDYYLMYIVEGSLDVKLPDGNRRCEAGEFIVIPPRCEYAYTNSDPCEVSYMWVHFTGSRVDEALGEYGIKLFPNVNKIGLGNTVITRFQGIFDALAKQDRFRDRELSVLLERLLISLARRLSFASDSERSLSRAIGYINSSYNTPIRIPELARLENLSTSRFNAVFRMVTGMSPSEYIARTRMTAACELLVSTDMPVKEIGVLVGYEDSHFFSKMFTKLIGTSPSGFRQMTERNTED